MPGASAAAFTGTIALVDFGMGNLHSVARALAHASPQSRVEITSDPAVIHRAARVVFPGQGAMPDAMRRLAEHPGLEDAVREACRSKPVLGICLGEQMLLDASDEGSMPVQQATPSGVAGMPEGLADSAAGEKGGSPAACGQADRSGAVEPTRGPGPIRPGPAVPTRGLGLIPGRVVRFDAAQMKAAGNLKVPHMGWNRVYPTQPHPLWAGIEPGAYFYFVHSYYAKPDDPAHIAAITHYGGDFTCAVTQNNIFAIQFHPEKSAANGLRLFQNFTQWRP